MDIKGQNGDHYCDGNVLYLGCVKVSILAVILISEKKLNLKK